MALNMNTGAAVYNPATAAAQAPAAAPAQANSRYPAKEEIDGYLNFSLPSKDGNWKKLGSISVSLKSTNQKALTEWLLADPTRALKLLAKMKLDFQPAKSEGREFDMTAFED